MRKKIILSFLLHAVLCIGLLQAQSISEYRSQKCLNGWWDFIPVMTSEGKRFSQPGNVPVQGWIKNGMIVPGSWKKSGSELKGDSEFWVKWRVSDSYNFPGAMGFCQYSMVSKEYSGAGNK